MLKCVHVASLISCCIIFPGDDDDDYEVDNDDYEYRGGSDFEEDNDDNEYDDDSDYEEDNDDNEYVGGVYVQLHGLFHAVSPPHCLPQLQLTSGQT